MNKLKNYILIFSIIYLQSYTLFAQSNDTLKNIQDSSAVFFFYEKNYNLDSIMSCNLDTSLNNFQKYNPLKQDDKHFASLGNIGLSNKNIIFIPYASMGFNYGIHSFDNYLYNCANIKYYKVLNPFTDLFYVQGGSGDKIEQFFRVTHSQQIRRGLTLGLVYRVISSLGNYNRQRSNNTNVAFKARYSSKNKRYGFISNYIHNNLDVYENGGIKYDSIFEKNIEKDRRMITVNLKKAENKWKESGFYIKQFFKLNKDFSKVNNDSLSKEQTKKHFKLGRIYHSFKYLKQTQEYKDDLQDNNFYHNIFKDSLNTYDKIGIKYFENVLSWANADKTMDPILFSINLKHKYTELLEYSGTSDYKIKYFNQFIPYAKISINISKGLSIKGNISYVNGDYNGGDYKIHTQISQLLGNTNHNIGSITFYALMLKQQAGYFYNHYSSNNFQWDNDFEKQKLFSWGLKYKFKTLETGVNYYNVNNFVYLDTAALPEQSNKKINVLKAYIYKEFKFKKLDIDSKFIYQHVSGDNVLRLPDIIYDISVYYNLSLFHNALNMQSGFDVFYNSKYYAEAYMPAIKEFYIQNDKKIGNYPYIDFFINLKIKRTRIFLKYQHLNSGIGGYNYYTTPHYPMQDGIFKYGVSWMFHN